MAECSPGILEDLGLPLSTAEREFTVAVFHALKPALSTGFFGLAFIFVAFIFVVVVVRLFVCLFDSGFLCEPWLSWNSSVDQASLKVPEIRLPLPPGCWE